MCPQANPEACASGTGLVPGFREFRYSHSYWAYRRHLPTTLSPDPQKGRLRLCVELVERTRRSSPRLKGGGFRAGISRWPLRQFRGPPQRQQCLKTANSCAIRWLLAVVECFSAWTRNGFMSQECN
jgi:hypothetical protein